MSLNLIVFKRDVYDVVQSNFTCGYLIILFISYALCLYALDIVRNYYHRNYHQNHSVMVSAISLHWIHQFSVIVIILYDNIGEHEQYLTI